jgi:exodeoxyribonuclease V alpha subunit
LLVLGSHGDQGFITAIGEDDAGKPTMTIAFDGREVIYIEKQFRQVRLAYAITTHRFQGSEAPAVVVVMLSKHYVMLSRPWLYTSLTRGKQRVVLIAEERAVRVAVTSTRKDERLTMLAPRIHALTTGSTDLRSAAVLDTERLLRGPR